MTPLTARDEMAALVSGDPHTPLQGVDKWYLDAIASLATNPETAPVVFRWLVEAGVLDLCLVHNGVRGRHYHPAGERGDE